MRRFQTSLISERVAGAVGDKNDIEYDFEWLHKAPISEMDYAIAGLPR
jgi:hypothetical protein